MRFLKWLGIALGLLIVLVAGTLAWFAEPDLPAARVEAEYLTPTSRFISLPDGTRVHVRLDGNPADPVIVLLHGSNASLHTWEGWTFRLKDRFHIVSMDLPGHGLTGPVPGGRYGIGDMVEFVDQAVNVLHLQRFALAGNSMGGNVAWRYTLAHPDKVSHLVLVDASGYPRTTRPFIYRLASLPLMGWAMERVTPEFMVRAQLAQVFADDAKVTDAMVARYHTLLLREGNREATGRRILTPPDLLASPEVLKPIQAPTLIIWGEQDEWAPAEWGRRFAADIPGATLKVYSGLGHVPMEESPDETAADVAAFLSR